MALERRPIDRVGLLKTVPLFSSLTEQALQKLADRCLIRSVPSGYLLFAEGDQSKGLYIVEHGRARIYTTSREGREQILHIQDRGGMLGEVSILDGDNYAASAVTTEPTCLLFLPRAAFEEYYRSSPEIAHAIIKSLGRRLRALIEVTDTLAFHDVAARLAIFLVNTAEREGVRTGNDSIRLRFERTQEEVAIAIGAARESVSRAKKQLIENGLIEQCSSSLIHIPSIKALRDRAHS